MGRMVHVSLAKVIDPEMKKGPNKVMQPSRLLVTSPAFAGLAPSNRLAHDGRWAENILAYTRPSAIVCMP
jgi:hypothetical protein